MTDAPQINVLATQAFRLPAKSSAARKAPDGSGAGPAPTQVGLPKRAAQAPNAARASQFQRPNPQTNAGGLARITGVGERQLDNTHTSTFEPPQKRPGLAERQPAPRRVGESGLEAAMAAEADRLHPRRLGPRRS